VRWWRLLALVAIADYFFQYRQWFERQKMSLAGNEGGVQAVGRRSAHQGAGFRQLRHARMKKRMMAAVPKASVIITNPTHYAVALVLRPRPCRRRSASPRAVDSIALKIREVAKAHNIPIVENVPLARALHAHGGDRRRNPGRALFTRLPKSSGYVMGPLKRGAFPGEGCEAFVSRARCSAFFQRCFAEPGPYQTPVPVTAPGLCSAPLSQRAIGRVEDARKTRLWRKRCVRGTRKQAK